MNMARSSQGYFPDPSHSESSSSQSPPQHVTLIDESDDDDDPAAQFSRDQASLQHDPLDEDGDIVSSKRQQKQPASAVPKFLSSSTPSGQSSLPTSGTGTPRHIRNRSNGGISNANQKDGGPLDWYAEGPGRRVGYENMTAIDWIFEYTKERQRLRTLYSTATGMLGHARRFLDTSQIWVLLVLTGLATGLVAASIDIASDWLADLKTGYCSAGSDGGKFYLNKYFCCWGYDEWSQCQDWVPWSVALHVKSTGGVWFVEYLFFIVYSVGAPLFLGFGY